jgi:hypothetical protein
LANNGAHLGFRAHTRFFWIIFLRSLLNLFLWFQFFSQYFHIYQNL